MQIGSFRSFLNEMGFIQCTNVSLCLIRGYHLLEYHFFENSFKIAILHYIKNYEFLQKTTHFLISNFDTSATWHIFQFQPRYLIKIFGINSAIFLSSLFDTLHFTNILLRVQFSIITKMENVLAISEKSLPENHVSFIFWNFRNHFIIYNAGNKK